MTLGDARSTASVQSDVSLGPLTTLEVGGPARYFVEATRDDDIRAALAFSARNNLRAWILGGGSNVVVPDEGLDGLVVRVSTRGIAFEDAGSGHVDVTAAAGEPWDDFVAAAVERGLGGLECLSGIPGLVGASPVQNVGAYGQEVAETITRVRVMDRQSLAVTTLDGPACHFSYRDSLFKSQEPDRHVVLSVTYRLAKDAMPCVRYAQLERRLRRADLANPTLRDVRQHVLAIRAEKSMVLGDANDENRRSCGSFFTNPVVPPALADEILRRSGEHSMPRYPAADGRQKLSAGWLIERAGFSKGYRQGAVGLSSRHALAIVCHDSATADDVVQFAERIVARVRAVFDVTLVPEPNLWGRPR